MSVIQPHFGVLLRDKRGVVSSITPPGDRRRLADARKQEFPRIDCCICARNIFTTSAPASGNEPRHGPGPGHGLFMCQPHKQIIDKYRASLNDKIKPSKEPHFLDGVSAYDINLLVLKYMQYRYKRERQQRNGAGNQEWTDALKASSTFSQFEARLENDIDTWYASHGDGGGGGGGGDVDE